MTARRSQLLATPTGGLASTAGCPDDGREYGEIGPATDTLGERVVKWHQGEHTYGRAVSEPTPGEHIDKGWSIDRRAAYWIHFVSDDDLAAYLRGDKSVGIWVRTTRAWLVPNDAIPPQRAGD